MLEQSQFGCFFPFFKNCISLSKDNIYSPRNFGKYVNLRPLKKSVKASGQYQNRNLSLAILDVAVTKVGGAAT